MKKTLKVGLAILAASSMASSAYAEVKGSITGRARGGYIMYSGDGGGATDMVGDGRLGYKVSTKAGSWTGTGYVEIDSSAMTARDRMVNLSNDSMSYTLGNIDPGSSMLGGANFAMIDDTIYPGDAARGDYFVAHLKKVGLSLVLSQNETDYDGDADTTGDTSNNTATAARFSGKAGAISYTAAFASVGTAVDDKRDNHSKGGSLDGASITKMNFGGKMDMGKMAVSGAYGTVGKTAGTAGAKTATTTELALVLDMDMGSGAGLSAGYGTETTNAGTDGAKDNVTTVINVTYKMPIGPVPLYLAYQTKSVNDGSATTANTAMGATLVYGF